MISYDELLAHYKKIDDPEAYIVKNLWAIPQLNSRIKSGLIGGGRRVTYESIWTSIIQLGMSNVARDIELVDLGIKLGCLDFLIKADLDRKSVVVLLMMDNF